MREKLFTFSRTQREDMWRRFKQTDDRRVAERRWMSVLSRSRRRIPSVRAKVLVRRLVEASTHGNLDALDELVADNFVEHSPYAQGGMAGAEGVKQFTRMLRSGFPDSQWIIDDLIAEGDKVVMRWSSRATHQGEAFGIPATGRPVVVTGIEIYRVSGGKLAEHWTEVDMLSVMQQLGVVPQPGQVDR